MSDSLPQLTMYGAMWCPSVVMARARLNREGIPFVYKDIDRDPGAMDELFALRGKAWVVPTFVMPNGSVLDNPPIQRVIEQLDLTEPTA